MTSRRSAVGDQTDSSIAHPSMSLLPVTPGRYRTTNSSLGKCRGGAWAPLLSSATPSPDGLLQALFRQCRATRLQRGGQQAPWVMAAAASGSPQRYRSDPLELDKKCSLFQSASDLRAIIWCDSPAPEGALPVPNDCYYDQRNGPSEGSATSNRQLIALAAGGGRSQR